MITIDTGTCTISSIYKPPTQSFQIFHTTDNFHAQANKIVVGDFNSHSTAWGYRTTNDDGTAVELWADTENLSLLHDAKLPSSFNSGRWKRGYNPDLIFTSSNIRKLCLKSVGSPIPRTQHRPIICKVQAAIKPTEVPFRRRFNFSKADWDSFSKQVDEKLFKIDPIPQNYDQFVTAVKTVSRQCIPRGCRSQYIPGLSPDSAKFLETYKSLYSRDPFSQETIDAGEELMLKVSESRKEKWIQTIEKLDLTKNSKKAWSTLRKLTDEPPHPKSPPKVTANQIAHQLLLNGKPPNRLPLVPKQVKHLRNSSEISTPFILSDIITAIKAMKNGKAAGVDDLTVEQIKHLGLTAVSWLLALFNSCLADPKLPKQWRKAKVVALLKPGKSPDDPKSFRPISLLCHTYKLFERLILNRLMPVIDPKLIPEQAGFRPGKSCTGQILRLTQYIEDGYEDNKITGVVLVDLSAAYDTVNIKKLLTKITSLTDDQCFVNVLGEMLRNRRFQVHLESDKSRWRCSKNGLPQGSVLAPILFNVYTNDQPSSDKTERFLYADDLALATRTSSFEDAEANLQKALTNLSVYYESNALRPNPSKTVSSVFHLKNHQANRQLKISWRGANIEHTDHPTYLGATLDRSLTYKGHCTKTKLKVNTRNNLLRRLTSTSWGATPQVLRMSSLALCFSAGEFACPVWHRSAHARKVDVALNETCRIITGCLQPTPLAALYPLTGIAPPEVRRAVACQVEKSKQETDARHPLHGSTKHPSRLKSRNSFLSSTEPLMDDSASEARINLWLRKHPPPADYVVPAEELPPGHRLPWPTWKSLNRLRTQVGRCRYNLVKWGYSDVSQCECGESTQTMSHLLSCPSCTDTCTLKDLCEATQSGVNVAKFWQKNV